MGHIMHKSYPLVDCCVGRAGSLEEIPTIWGLIVVTVVLGASKIRQDPGKLQLYCLL